MSDKVETTPTKEPITLKSLMSMDLVTFVKTIVLCIITIGGGYSAYDVSRTQPPEQVNSISAVAPSLDAGHLELRDQFSNMKSTIGLLQKDMVYTNQSIDMLSKQLKEISGDLKYWSRRQQDSLPIRRRGNYEN